MSNLTPVEKFWSEVLPECASSFAWGIELGKLKDKNKIQKGLKSVMKNLDEGEFDLFTAQIVIKASATGVVGAELTEIIGWFTQLRA